MLNVPTIIGQIVLNYFFKFFFIFLHIALLYYHIYPTPPLGQDMTQGQFFKRSLTGFNSEFFLLLD